MDIAEEQVINYFEKQSALKIKRREKIYLT